MFHSWTMKQGGPLEVVGGGGQGSKRADSVILTACLCILADVGGARTRTRNRGPRWLDADTTHLHNQRGLLWRNGLKKKSKIKRKTF